MNIKKLQQECICLKALSGLTQEQIADKSNESIHTIKRILNPKTVLANTEQTRLTLLGIKRMFNKKCNISLKNSTPTEEEEENKKQIKFIYPINNKASGEVIVEPAQRLQNRFVLSMRAGDVTTFRIASEAELRKLTTDLVSWLDEVC